jgi:hypothetical protein
MDPRRYSIKQMNYKSITIRAKGEVINQLLNDLHADQLEMIDNSVEASDMKEAQCVIDRIRSMK